MPAPYTEITGLGASNGSTGNLYTLFKFLNDESTGGYMIPVILLSIWFIAMFGSLSNGRPFARAFLFASFLCAVLSILLTLIGLLNREVMYFLFLMVAAGLVWFTLDNAPGI